MQSDIKFNFQGTMIWLICALFYAYELLLRTVLGTFQTPITHELALTPLSFAFMSTSCYLLVYSMMQVPAGIIAQKHGLKKSLTFAVGICAFSGLAFTYVYEFKSAVVIRMLMGLGSSFGFVCLLMAVYDWMPKRYYGLLIGLSQFIGTMGPMFAAGPLNSLMLALGTNWRVVQFGLGIAGILLTFMVICFVKNNRDKADKFRIINKPMGIHKSLYQTLRQSQIWLIAIYSALVYFSVEYLSENEGKAFLELNGHSSQFSSYMLTIAWLGFALGCPILGGLSDFFKRRKLMMILAASSCLLSMIGIVYFPLSKTMLALCFFMMGFGAGGQSIGFAIMAEQCNKAYLAIGLGFNNAVITLLISFNAPVVGYLLSFYSQSENLQLADYRFAFTFIISLIAIALVLSVFCIKETYCRLTKGFTLIRWLGALKPKVYTNSTLKLGSRHCKESSTKQTSSSS